MSRETVGKIEKGRMIIMGRSIQTTCVAGCKKGLRVEGCDPGEQARRREKYFGGRKNEEEGEGKKK